MKFEYLLIVASYAYTLSALVRFAVARSKPCPDHERKKRLDILYGREDASNQ